MVSQGFNRLIFALCLSPIVGFGGSLMGEFVSRTTFANPYANIPAQCYIETSGGTQNACMFCHTNAPARSRLGNNNPQAGLSSALSKLMLVVEKYPDLKANENFIQLSDELAGTENRIAVARQEYNAVARDFNKVAKSFPMNIFAKMFGFDNAAYFEASEGAEEVPTVDFNN